MTLPTTQSRVVGADLIRRIDDFMSWLLFGYETWLVALLKGVPLFLYTYFLLAYVPNYVYYGFTQYIGFLKFTPETGFIFAFSTGAANFVVLIILGMWTQAARGRSGFAWSLIRVLDFLQLLFVFLLLIPLLAFNMAGGTFFPATGESPLGSNVCVGVGSIGFCFPFAVAFGLVVAALGAAALGFLYFEYGRITRREAQLAKASSASYQAG